MLPATAAVVAVPVGGGMAVSVAAEAIWVAAGKGAARATGGTAAGG